MLENDYNSFNSNDFLQDDFFISWMQYKDAETNKWWTNWLQAHPERNGIVRDAQAKYKLLRSFKKIHLSERETKQAWQQLLTRIDYPVQPRFKILSTTWFRTAAACLLLGALLFLYLEYYPGKEYKFVANESIQEINLEDGTHVVLNKGATLTRYSKRSRQVWVKGQAYFEVNKARTSLKKPIPFIVHADDFDVKVTGTVFMVSADPGDKGVVLTEGHVSLIKGKNILNMRPGEYVSISNNDLKKSYVTPALFTAWKDKEFTFNNTSLNELKILVKNIYHLDLNIFSANKLKHRELNGVVNIESRESFMKTISVLLDAQVYVESNQLIIKPNK